jgi:hypothetical protein
MPPAISAKDTVLQVIASLDRVVANLTPLSYACPTCEAAKGVACLRPGGKTHLPRWDLCVNDRNLPLAAWRRDVTVYGEPPERVLSRVQQKAARLLSAMEPS